jgi:hypothetical protein
MQQSFKVKLPSMIRELCDLIHGMNDVRPYHCKVDKGTNTRSIVHIVSQSAIEGVLQTPLFPTGAVIKHVINAIEDVYFVLGVISTKRHGTHQPALKPNSTRYSVSSKYQYLPLKVVPYMDFCNLTGMPQNFAYSGIRNPRMLLRVTKFCFALEPRGRRL